MALSLLDSLREADHQHPQYAIAKSYADKLIALYQRDDVINELRTSSVQRYNDGDGLLGFNFNTDRICELLRDLGIQIGTELNPDDPANTIMSMFNQVFYGEIGQRYQLSDDEKKALLLTLRFFANFFREQGFYILYEGKTLTVSW